MRLLLLLPFFYAVNSITAQQSARQFRDSLTVIVDYQYLLFTPTNKQLQNDSGQVPLVVFLHGAGERGTDVQKVKVHGPPKIVDQDPDFPFMVLSPLCPINKRWDEQALSALLDYVIRQHAVDTQRIYLTGLSMGGQGVWDLAMLRPNTFAAIAPICGGDYMHAYMVDLIKHLPVWVFHGAMDTVVPLENSVRIVKALQKLNADVQFTVYPTAGHDSWTETYHNPLLYEWFLTHKKN